jgi:carbon-monoxide dehydrogenase medium subunit
MARALSFLRPSSVEEAVSMLDEHGDEAKVVAGSTALTIMLRNRLIDPSVLVSIGRMPGLSEIKSENGYLHLGSLATHRDVELSPIARDQIPVLTDTFHRVANVRVRNVATVGGVVAEADYASDPPAVFLALDAEIDVQGPNGQRTIPANEFFLSFYTTALEPDSYTHLTLPTKLEV